MWTTGCAVRSTGGLLGEGQTLEGDFEQTSLTTESRWGHHRQASPERLGTDEPLNAQSPWKQ